MSYVHITKTPGITTADYKRVVEAMGETPIAGNLQHIVGEAAGSLHTVDVWESKEHADRFAAERLFPAFQRTGVHPPVDSLVFAFETGDTVPSSR